MNDKQEIYCAFRYFVYIDLNYEELRCSKCGYTPNKKVERKSNETGSAVQMRLLRETDAVDGINETSRKAA